MGQSNSMYQDGDIPREIMNIFTNTKGFAYYSSSVSGQCFKCSETTTWWFVCIKSRGKYICQSCKSDNKINNQVNINKLRNFK